MDIALVSQRETRSGLVDRREALITFLGAGMAPLPTRALLVSALSGARCSVAALRHSEQLLGEWLKSEIRHPGIRENAAMLATIEILEMPDRAMREFSRKYPDRDQLLQDMLSCL